MCTVYDDGLPQPRALQAISAGCTTVSRVMTPDSPVLRRTDIKTSHPIGGVLSSRSTNRRSVLHWSPIIRLGYMLPCNSLRPTQHHRAGHSSISGLAAMHPVATFHSSEEASSLLPCRTSPWVAVNHCIALGCPDLPLRRAMGRVTRFTHYTTAESVCQLQNRLPSCSRYTIPRINVTINSSDIRILLLLQYHPLQPPLVPPVVP